MPNDTFIWTDELVRDFYLNARKEPSYPIKQRIEDFKQSKIKEKWKISVDVVIVNDGLGGEMIEIRPIGFGHTIPRDKFQELTNAVKSILNDEPIEEQKIHPLSGEFMTKEKCNELVNEAFERGKNWKSLGEHLKPPRY